MTEGIKQFPQFLDARVLRPIADVTDAQIEDAAMQCERDIALLRGLYRLEEAVAAEHPDPSVRAKSAGRVAMIGGMLDFHERMGSFLYLVPKVRKAVEMTASHNAAIAATPRG